MGRMHAPGYVNRKFNVFSFNLMSFQCNKKKIWRKILRSNFGFVNNPKPCVVRRSSETHNNQTIFYFSLHRKGISGSALPYRRSVPTVCINDCVVVLPQNQTNEVLQVSGLIIFTNANKAKRMKVIDLRPEIFLFCMRLIFITHYSLLRNV